jgi:hypothetical protein
MSFPSFKDPSSDQIVYINPLQVRVIRQSDTDITWIHFDKDHIQAVEGTASAVSTKLWTQGKALTN